MGTSSNLERKAQKLIVRNNIFMLLLILCIGYILNNQFKKSIKNDIIYAKGIVILDEQGKERVLIGAPIPKSKDRIRDNNEKAMKAWADDFDPQYKEWYKDYSHENYGMLILDENGFDRLAVGSPNPDPNIGKRLGPATGIAIYDEKGYERSGYNLLRVGGKNRVVLGLDRNNGTEGLALFVNDDGSTGIYMNSESGKIFLGKAEQKNHYIKDFPFSGIFMKNDSLKKELIFNALEKDD